MVRGPWSRRVLATGLVLIGAIFAAGPAAAAPCTGPYCYRYWADISITGAWMSPSLNPIPPGTMHSYTALVTNTGWRTGGLSGPVPWPGPASGTVYVAFEPSTPLDQRIGCHIDVGPPSGCFGGYNNGLAFDVGSMPTNTTYQLTTYFRAPPTPGTYTLRIWIYAFQGGNPWTEYNPNNNELTLTYQVGYNP
jgi:hypothetical protein